MKLNTKVNLLSTLLTSIILIGSFTGIYFLFKELAVTTEAEQLQQRSNELASAISSLPSAEGIDTIFRAYIPSDGAIIVSNAQGSNILRLQMTSENIDIVTNKSKHYTMKTIAGIPHIAMETPLIWPTQEVVTAKLIQPVPTLTENLQRLQIILVLTTLVALLPIYFASQLLVRLIVNPIQQMTATMERNIQQSSFDQIPQRKKSKDEIAQMALTYNNLMGQLENSHANQQQFIGNASHELRTPLTVIESYAKLLKRRGTQDAQVTDEAITAIIQESENMKFLIEQMLALAKTNETMKITIAHFALKSFITNIAQSFQAAYHREIKVDVPDITIQTDEAKLKQLLFIFLDNARKYSEDAIEFTATVHKDVLQLRIKDSGIGIPKEDIPKLFNRFYRVDKDRNRKTGGVGIGLSIASQLAERLGATIQIDSELGQGTTINIGLPMHGGGKYEA